jgi:hypothetical protein
VDDKPVEVNALIRDAPKYSVKGQFESIEDSEAKRLEDAKAADYKRSERFMIVCFTLVMLLLFSGFCVFLYSFREKGLSPRRPESFRGSFLFRLSEPRFT